MAATIHSAIACNLDTNILVASLPLFENEKVDAIEWSFDTLFKKNEIPEWFSDLLSEFASNRRLVGHGVYFSIFSGKWLPEQQDWLDKLRVLSRQFRFDHISEHFGFLTGADFHKGAPLSIPFNQTTLSIGHDRLARIRDACECPVGLENLAFAYSMEEVKRHGAFLDRLVSGVNGFIILDLHNLYCQCHNFGVNFQEMLPLYPLDRVREIHISGGSWDDRTVDYNKIIRRDTHDESVPEEVFEMLKAAIPQCPNLKYVVLEQMGTALDSESEQLAFQSDFLKMDRIVKSAARKLSWLESNQFLPKAGEMLLSSQPLQSEALFNQQMLLSEILETAENANHARELLSKSALAHSDWHIEQWENVMLETAVAIARKWKEGFK